jgi:hypothetical protein
VLKTILRFVAIVKFSIFEVVNIVVKALSHDMECAGELLLQLYLMEEFAKILLIAEALSDLTALSPSTYD